MKNYNSYVQVSGAGMAHHNVMSRGRRVHSTAGVMANAGFGRVTVTIDGERYALPENAVRMDGVIKKAWQKVLAMKNGSAIVEKGAVIC